MLLINCEIKVDLTWSINCVIYKILRTPKVRDNPAEATETKRATFKTKNAKLYVPIVTLSINHDNF